MFRWRSECMCERMCKCVLFSVFPLSLLSHGCLGRV